MPESRKIRALIEKIFARKTDRLVLNAIHLSNQVKGEDGNHTSDLRAGQAYGHSIELLRNYAVWPISVHVVAKIREQGQLSYRSDPKQWEFTAELLPNHGIGARTEVLYCNERISGKDEILTMLTCNETHSDIMNLEFNIE